MGAGPSGAGRAGRAAPLPRGPHPGRGHLRHAHAAAPEPGSGEGASAPGRASPVPSRVCPWAGTAALGMQLS